VRKSIDVIHQQTEKFDYKKLQKIFCVNTAGELAVSEVELNEF
jgi:hypothetical protein